MFNEFVLSNVWRKLSLSRAINVYHRIKVKRIATTRRARFAANKNRVSRDWRGRWGTSSRRNLAIPAVPLADDYPRTSIIYPAAISDDRDSESPTDRMHTIRRRPSSIAVLPRAQILIPQTQFGNFLFSTGSSGRVKMRRDGKRRTKSVRRAGAPRSRVVVEEWKKKKIPVLTPFLLHFVSSILHSGTSTLLPYLANEYKKVRRYVHNAWKLSRFIDKLVCLSLSGIHL